MTQEPFDIEVQQDMEIVFDCCGCMTIRMPRELATQLRDDLNGQLDPNNQNPRPSVSGSVDVWFTRPTTGPNAGKYIDLKYTWNANVSDAAGRVTYSFSDQPATANSDPNAQDANILPPNDVRARLAPPATTTPSPTTTKP